jgi:glycosyltransferase 2 family protein
MKKYRFIIGILVSAFFLYLVFRNTNLNETIKIITSINAVYILLICILTVLFTWVRSIRWKMMLADYGKIPAIRFFEATSIRIMINNLLPFRAGDITQIYLLAQNTNLSKSAILSTVILERLCDFFVMCATLICGSFFVLLPGGISKEKIALLMAFVLFCIFVVFRTKERLVELLNRILPDNSIKARLIQTINNFYTGMEFIKKKEMLAKMVFLSSLLWLLSSFGLYLCFLAVRIKLSYLAAVFLLALTGIAAMIPFAPGSLGPLEFLLTTGLVISGIEKNYAVSFALVNRLMSWLPSNLLGLIMLVRSNLSIKQVTRAEKDYRASRKVT